ncbi:uncharacterized protein ColSpa_02881 [Colletotrichum spaethianum]|uniref:Uncharacterized protein n=1 Tax=Colletotrichum spaethianum TaxID=700344 RepID=A0AA37LB27_9PEZI|nr:uncharacterized protein ColSpa_02881 [Colletotrichum spaethianum]GKT42700.1 hypothetical protein ColSpa_02881 [Colletotrichum spaethianum]
MASTGCMDRPEGLSDTPPHPGHPQPGLPPDQRLPEAPLQTPSQDHYAMAAFALVAAGFPWQVFPLTRAAGLLTAAKLLVLFLCVAFLPGLASHNAKAIIKAVISTIHAVVLMVWFPLPALFSALRVQGAGARRSNADEGVEVGI